MTAAKTTKTTKPAEPTTEPIQAAPVASKREKPRKLNHHAYESAFASVGGVDREVFVHVVTFGTRTEAIEYALPRKWDVVSGLPGVPLTELIAAVGS